MAGGEVEVVFVDAGTGARLGATRLPRDRVLESFDAQTTVEIGGATWHVEHATPSAAADIAVAGELVLNVRRVDHLPPADILYSLPTICDSLPPVAARSAQDCLRMHEDDWRQVELVSRSLHDVIAAELDAVRAVYQVHARRGAGGRLAGFAEIHVRNRPEQPLPGPLSRRQLLDLLPESDRAYGGVGFDGSPGAVAGSFARAYGPHGLYGIADEDRVSVLGLSRLASGDSPPAVLIAALRQVMEASGAVIVDWCGCSVIDSGALAGYLA